MDSYDYAKSKEPGDLTRRFAEFVKRDDEQKWQAALKHIVRLESALREIAKGNYFDEGSAEHPWATEIAKKVLERK